MHEQSIQVTDQLTFNPDKYTALLSVPQSVVQSSMERMAHGAEEYSLLPKPEFHMTLIGFALGGKLKRIIQKIPKPEQENISTLLTDVLAGYEWEYELKDTFYLIEKKYQFRNQPSETRTSIIQTVSLPDLTDLYSFIGESFATTIDPPFPHLTLYTNSTNPRNETMGIGINSVPDFENLHSQLLS